MDVGDLDIVAYCGYCIREKEKCEKLLGFKQGICIVFARSQMMMSKIEECGHTQQDTYRTAAEGLR